jgi:hypothetical protein
MPAAASAARTLPAGATSDATRIADLRALRRVLPAGPEGELQAAAAVLLEVLYDGLGERGTSAVHPRLGWRLWDGAERAEAAAAAGAG